jgi:Zn-dependent peptidase ImmA (M78 family)/DNA-binding XRE family transcriptional regulator
MEAAPVGLAERLAVARARSGYGQEDVANALGVSRAMVSYWEAGSRTPNDRQLAALAQLLRVPVGFLLGQEELQPTVDLGAMIFRGGDHELPAEARHGLQEFVDFLDRYARLAQASKFPVHSLHQSPFVSAPGFEHAEDARRKAEEVRSSLRLGLGPVGDIDNVCDMLGVTVYRADLGEDLSQTVSGAFLNHTELGLSILVNLAMTPGRRRFTVAHELAHALFHSNERRYVVSTAAKDPRERFADTFAGEFLMPAEGVRRVMEEQGFGPRIDDATEVIHLQRFFGVSFITALVRLRQARVLTQARFDEYKLVRPVVLARALGYEIAEEEYGPRPTRWRLERFPPRFRRLLRHAVQREVLSVPSAASMAGLSIDEVIELVAAFPPTSSETSSPELFELGEFEASGVLSVA